MSLDLDSIRERSDAATPGPWTPEEFGDAVWGPDGDSIVSSECGITGNIVLGGSTVDNCIFIAHARTDVPALLAEVERLRAELADARATIREATARLGVIADSLGIVE